MMLDLRHISTDKLRTAWEEDFNLLLFMSLLKSKWYKGLIKQNDVSWFHTHVLVLLLP